MTLAVVSSLLFAVPLAALASPVPKQLSGSAEEFAQMRTPDPADSAIYSHSALLPVEISTREAGWQREFPVENGKVRFLVFSGNNGNWMLELQSPTGRRIPAQELSSSAQHTDFALEQARIPSNYYALDGLESGTWALRIDAGASRSLSGYVLLEGDPATELMSYPAHRRQVVGQQLDVVATLGGSAARANGARVVSATLRVTGPDGSVRSYPMFDDGLHADAKAGDGLFGAGFVAEQSGQYLAQVVADGANADGQRIVRTAEHVLPVVDASLRLASTEAVISARSLPNGRLSLDLPVVASKQGQHYRAYAEVWGTDAKGNARPAAWVGGMVTPDKNGLLSLGFDPRWITRADAQPPYQLRELRVEDPDHFITLASARSLGLDLPDRRLLGAAPKGIDEAMRMGPRPVGSEAVAGVGQRLILVHGYCSGGVWPAAQFTNASSFLDANQNRSHDQFARLLQDFGSTWNSFGTVAHSQGGAASLHLYTYYWSGLDNATGARLIQSVGTPYKGTNLAGILATLGSWFGAGCGSNDNLTYSGASAWLAGIPTSSRAKVNYYTTSFRSTNWWTNDYCQIATDLVLSDPEDGTTEQTNGQLSGGVNRGHTTGQCHTSGMRDPAQYLDASRNATMNANAAR
ncbi:MAG: conditioned medium factor [Rhodanobacteraceae bacterium]|nr:conditioned medium factor [Rhodanobacteraceae bacterium]